MDKTEIQQRPARQRAQAAVDARHPAPSHAEVRHAGVLTDEGVGMRRGALIAAAVVALAGAATAGVLLSGGTDPARTGAQPEAQPSAQALSGQVLSAQRADEITAQLASGNETGVREVLALPPGQDLDPGFAQDLAALDLEIDESTFEATGPDEGTVDATTNSGTVWETRLSRIEGAWFVVSTTPKAGS